MSLVIFSLTVTSCKKFISIDPPSNRLVRKTVFEDDGTAKASISELYAQMRSSSGNINGLYIIAGLSSDELVNLNLGDSHSEFFQNSILSTNDILSSFWNEYYTQIYYANNIIEGLNNSNAVTQKLKNELIAEAKFVRSFCHFYLTNLFGDIPYITGTNYELNSVAARMPKNEVYGFIIKDLLEAKKSLASDYSVSGGERIRPNKYVATALLARVYLYAGNWVDAEIQSTEIITHPTYKLCEDLNSIFLKNSSEAIWQFHQEEHEMFTSEGNLFLNPATVNYTKLSDMLIASFEALDERKTVWTQQIIVDTEVRFIPYKYKDFNGSSSDTPEYSTVLRLAEQFLIRAEARAQLDKLTGVGSAESDLNTIRLRAGLNPTNASIKEDLLQDISNQMRLEFFTEWGHRWLYLKHTGKADDVLSPVKRDWNSDDKLYPIPYTETLINPNMRQNPSY